MTNKKVVLVFMVMFLLVLTTQTSANEYIDDTFNTGIGNWTIIKTSGTPVTHDVNAMKYDSGQNNNPLRAHYIHGVGITPTEISFDVNCSNSNAGEPLSFVTTSGGYASPQVAVRFCDNDKIQYFDGTLKDVQAASANVVYEISLRNIDYGTDTYDIWVDGVEKITGAAFQVNGVSDDYFGFNTGDTSPYFIARIDNFCISDAGECLGGVATTTEIVENYAETDSNTTTIINTNSFTTILTDTLVVEEDNTTNYITNNLYATPSTNNQLECQILFNSSAHDSLLARDMDSGQTGSLYLMTGPISLNTGNYTIDTQCRRSGGGGTITISDIDGSYHNWNQTLNYAYVKASVLTSTGSFEKVGAFNYTTNPSGNIVTAVDFQVNYQSVVTDLLSTRISVGGNNCTQFQRQVDAGDSGSVGGGCLIHNLNNNTQYEVELFAKGNNANFTGKIFVKSFTMNQTQTGNITFTNQSVTSTTPTKIANFSIQNVFHGADPMFTGIYISQNSTASTRFTYQARLSGNSNDTGHINNISSGLNIRNSVHKDDFSGLGVGAYQLELWSSCQNLNCVIANGEFIGYMTGSVTITQDVFNITAIDNETSQTITSFTATNSENLTFSTTNGVISLPTFKPMDNFTIDSGGYQSRTYTDWNTSTDLQAVLLKNVDWSVDYTTPIIENTNQTIVFRVENNSDTFNIINASLTWNGTTQSVTINNSGGNFTATSTFNTPLVVGDINITFTWDVDVNTTDGTENILTTQNQTIVSIGIDNCSVFTTRAINMTLRNESSPLGVLTGSVSGHFEVWIDSASSFVPFNLTWTGGSNYGICIDPASANYSVNAQMLYSAPNFAEKTYYFDNATFSNNLQNLDLWLSSATTQVTLAVTDENDNPLEGALIHILSYDIATDSYKTSEIVQTDFNGNAFGQMVLNTQWYRFFIYYNDELVLETTETKVLTTSINFRVSLEEDFFENYDIVRDVACTLSFNDATNNFRYSWTDGSGSVSQATMNVIERSSISDTIINNTIGSGASGTLFIPITPKNLTYVASGTITIDGTTYACGTPSSITFGSIYETFGLEGIFLTFLVMITLTLGFVFDPRVAVAISAISVVIMVITGIFFMSWPWLIAFIIMAGIFMYRMNK